MEHVVSRRRISDAWHTSLRLFASSKSIERYDSERGPCLECGDVVLKIADPHLEPRISPLYPPLLHPLIERYSDGFMGKAEARDSTVSERLYQWPQRRSASTINQVDGVLNRLRSLPESRYNIVGFWDPDLDPDLEKPVSPLVASFRIRTGRLVSTLVARTVDAWHGAFPMFIGFANLHQYLATQANVAIGPISFYLLSYHVYEMDLPAVLHAMEVLANGRRAARR